MYPILFIGHGSPMNAIENNDYTKMWKNVAKRIPKPKVILAISAHWIVDGTKITSMEHPTTIHDFSGFPENLSTMEYPAPGSPELAAQIKRGIKSVSVDLDTQWGLDHGIWSILVHMYPQADIPVLQLSIDSRISRKQMFELGAELRQFREAGVLIIGAGNIVHNLSMIARQSPPWATAFQQFVKENIERKDYSALITTLHPAAKLAADEHYLPLLYVLGASEGENAFFFNEQITMGSISMMSVAFGLERF